MKIKWCMNYIYYLTQSLLILGKIYNVIKCSWLEAFIPTIIFLSITLSLGIFTEYLLYTIKKDFDLTDDDLEGKNWRDKVIRKVSGK